MTPSDPLAQLHDIQLPDDVSAWPPGPGWWLLMALAVIATAVIGTWLWRQLRPYLWQHRWLRRLPVPDHHNDYFVALNQWLKQVAMDARPDTDLAPLSGEAWIEYLHHRAPGIPRQELEKLTRSALTREPALPPESADRLARQWLRSQTC